MHQKQHTGQKDKRHKTNGGGGIKTSGAILQLWRLNTAERDVNG